jgi:ketosteroid isomerase-like protein
VPAVDERHRQGIERLFEAFNRRDVEAITELCDERMEFFAVTAEEVGRSEPYVGAEGMRAYLDDVATVWEELLITPKQVEQREDSLLVRGRVYLRSRALGIRDMPTAWIWDLRDGLFVRGRVFVDPEEAISLFSLEGQPGQSPDPGASRSTTRLR